VPHPTDETDPNTVPDPELNPLLNPLLAAHMGRWAEVYFTNPPEKRGQAISELLRELESLSPQGADPVQVVNPPSLENVEIKVREKKMETPESSLVAEELVPICPACAYNNSAEQHFCGMCGTPLQVLRETHVSLVAEGEPVGGASWSEPRSILASDSVESATEPAIDSVENDGHGTPSLAWLRSERELFAPAAQAEPVHFRYRLYTGVALAILLVVLIYMAWRGTEALSGSPVPQSKPSTVIVPAAAPVQPAPTSSTPQPNASALPTNPPSVSPGESQKQPESRNDQAADAHPTPRIVTVAASSSAITPGESGAEELALAEKYLNGNQGVTRDSAEAVQWLWKAVGKGNVAATMTLSDLFLRGDGVPKSCDQARLLLDAAARKGAKAAAERLRNLQGFGCQ
jgi:hypothetical protein